MRQFNAYVQAAEAEKSLKAAKRMVAFMDDSDMSALVGEDSDGTVVAGLYHTCARVCLEGAQSKFCITHNPLWLN